VYFCVVLGVAVITPADIAAWCCRHRKQLDELAKGHAREQAELQKENMVLEAGLERLCDNADDAVDLLPRGDPLRPRMRLTLIRGFTSEQVRQRFAPAFSSFHLTHAQPREPNADAAHFVAEYALLRQYFEQYPRGSKHNYRVVNCTRQQFYDRYCDFHTRASPQTEPLSQASVRRYMEGFHWRFEKHPLFCPYCDSLHNLEAMEDRTAAQDMEMARLLAHQRLYLKQREYYHATLQEMVDAEDTNRVVAVQDFSTFFIDKGAIPVLIVTLYTYDPVALDHLMRKYCYIMPTTDRTRPRMKNNTAFVAAAWNKLFATEYTFTDMQWNRLDIFSDGGPKHFKTTAHVHYWCRVKQQLGHDHTIRYTFFAPHHGENVCDAASHHAQTVQRSYEADHGPLRVNEDFGNLEQLGASREFFFIERPAARYLRKFKTLAGIKQYFVMQFIDWRTVRCWGSAQELDRAGTERVLRA